MVLSVTGIVRPSGNGTYASFNRLPQTTPIEVSWRYRLSGMPERDHAVFSEYATICKLRN